MQAILNDLRYALRRLGAEPLWTCTIIAVLALGIGVATAVFALVDGVLFRPLPIRDSDRVVYVRTQEHPHFSSGEGMPYPAYLGLRDEVKAFAAVSAWSNISVLTRDSNGQPTQASAMLVSGNYFDLFGVLAERGRLLSVADEHDALPVAVVSHDYWVGKLGGAEDVIGKSLTIHGESVLIVGVANAKFSHSYYPYAPDMWLTLAMYRLDAHQQIDALNARSFADPEHGWLGAIARLRDGVSVAAALAEVQVRDPKKSGGPPGSGEKPYAELVAFDTVIQSESNGPDHRRSAWLLLGAAGLILLVACANAMGLLLARNESRRQELAMRASLGASAQRIAVQLLVETALLALLASILGIFLASGLTHWVAALDGIGSALPLDVRDEMPNLRVLVAAIGCAALVTAIGGAYPAMRSRRLDLNAELRGTRSLVGGDRWRAGRALVALQVASCVVMLSAGGLMIQSLRQAWSVSPGFDLAHGLVMPLQLHLISHEPAQSDLPRQRVLDAVAQIPGLRSAAFATVVPVDSGSITSSFETDLARPASGERWETEIVAISPNYFRTLGVHLIAGRDFTSADTRTSESVVIITKTFSQRFWPNGDALDHSIKTDESGPLRRIVGVVDDVKLHDLWEAPLLAFYEPATQSTATFIGNVLARVEPGAEEPVRQSMLAALRVTIPDLPAPGQIESLEQHVGQQFGLQRGLLRALGGLAVCALLLTASGLYALLTFVVRQREREIGLRLAIGALPSDLVRMIAGRGIKLIAVGVAMGLLASYVLGFALQSFLLDVNAHDLRVLATVTAVSLVAGALGCWLPARRAAKVDPLQSLRGEN